MNITWRDSQYATKHGLVNGNLFFSISWKSTRADPNWVLSCTLPGREHERWKHDDENRLRETAVRVLEDWLREVFGIQLAGAADSAFDAWLTSDDGPLNPGYGPESPTLLKTRADAVVLLGEAYAAGWRERTGEGFQ